MLESDARLVLERGQVMTLPRELLYDSSLMLILQRPIEELAELRTLPPLAQLGPLLLPPLSSSLAPSSLSEEEDQEKLEGAVQLFAPRPEGHFLEVVVVFERPAGRAVLWVDVFEPAGGKLRKLPSESTTTYHILFQRYYIDSVITRSLIA